VTADERRAPGEKTRRPRDELGQLLPWDEEDRLRLEDFDALSLEECHQRGIEHLNAGRFFPAHEAWETAWKKAKGSEDEEFFKGLSQLGAGYTHYRRGNPHGAHTLLRRGVSRIGRYGSPHWGIDVRSLAEEAAAHADAIEAAQRGGREMPEIQPPVIGEVEEAD
jgi:predicted metal-dependent hydrolase